MTKLKVALEIAAQDNASKELKKQVESIKKIGKTAQEESKKTAKIDATALKEKQRLTEKTYQQIKRSAEQAAKAREQLGLRSERVIQLEIENTKRAYQQLKNSGVASSRELNRAWSQQKQRIAELNAEMGKSSKLAKFNGGVLKAGAAVAAGAYALHEPIKNSMSFDRRLAMVANTAFAERDVQGRIAGKQELFNAVETAVKNGGGSKDEALGALDKLLASGSVKTDTALKLLPTLQKASVATGSSTEDLAQIAISAMQQFGISEDKIGEVLDKAVAAGQAGNFELSDMARWLPQQMAAAVQAGLSGMDGFEALLVANQQARVTAGTSDEAGNNLVNLLAKITSRETTDRFKNLKYIDKNGKEVGINLAESMQNYKNKGQNSIQAFTSIIDDVVGNNTAYRQLQNQLKTAKQSEKGKILSEMAKILEGTAIGEVISDRQALMALIGIRNNSELGKEVQQSLNESDGAVEKSHAVIADSADFKAEDLNNTREFAQLKNLKSFDDSLGNVAKLLSDYGKEYPHLTQVLVGAADAVKTFGAALAAVSVLDLLGGKGGLGGLVGKGGIGRTIFNGAKNLGKNKLGLGLGVGATAAITGLVIAGENATNYFAQEEVKKEQQDKAMTNAYKAMTNNSPSQSMWNGYKPLLNNQKNEFIQGMGLTFSANQLQFSNQVAAERLKMGTLTADQYKERIEKNQQFITDMQQSISEGVKLAMNGATRTIENKITVELDGRTISETVSEYQYKEFSRGE
ncbi:phage tail tape measure protein [Mergibacter septicus]|uniref:phage tail tape measure protein n=1 Tax=Mergibacter septicus TaxID=221402 RepID=UPI001178F06E|nr:phage tail tape measure protein [Mergibacter septicus]AWX14275.1 phage tail tape measure protein [Mergibacter septicus]